MRGDRCSARASPTCYHPPFSESEFCGGDGGEGGQSAQMGAAVGAVADRRHSGANGARGAGGARAVGRGTDREPRREQQQRGAAHAARSATGCEASGGAPRGPHLAQAARLAAIAFEREWQCAVASPEKRNAHQHKAAEHARKGRGKGRRHPLPQPSLPRRRRRRQGASAAATCLLLVEGAVGLSRCQARIGAGCQGVLRLAQGQTQRDEVQVGVRAAACSKAAGRTGLLGIVPRLAQLFPVEKCLDIRSSPALDALKPVWR